MKYDDQAGIVVISPHLDDAALSAWSVIGAPNASVVVICAAIPPAGTRASADRVYGVDDSSELVRMRLKEDAEAMGIAGCPVEYLDFLDAAYRDAPIPVADLHAALDASVPAAAAICAPAGIGLHADHVAAREAALALARARGIPVCLYADIPYAVRMGWPHWVTGVPARPHLVPEAFWQADLEATSASLGWDDLTPRVQRLDANEVAHKSRAIEAYHTQYAALNAGPLGRVTNPEVIGFELHWDVRLS